MVALKARGFPIGLVADGPLATETALDINPLAAGRLERGSEGVKQTHGSEEEERETARGYFPQ